MKVEIPISKSFYARIAMIYAIAGIDIPYSDDNDDIIAIREALTTEGKEVWVGSSGTATRFAIAYYATMDREVVIDGSEQMRKRPISSIVEAVRAMGAEVEGDSLPLKIKGCSNFKNDVEVDASQSSQTISALMLIGMRRGIRIRTRGARNSWSYVELTAEVMKRCGIEVEIDEREVRVGKIEDSALSDVTIEKDWSSAVFWYGWCATRGDKVEIVGLKRRSFQPDETAVEIFGRLGVVSKETTDGITLTYDSRSITDERFEVDCRRTPDLAMVLIPTLCKLGKRFIVTGLETLDRKESRRGEALCCELRKAGYNTVWNGRSMCWDGARIDKHGNPEVYGDHRMVMGLMILGMEGIDLEPLSKSYSSLVYLVIESTLKSTP